jgi:hypothetical protein
MWYFHQHTGCDVVVVVDAHVDAHVLGGDGPIVSIIVYEGAVFSVIPWVTNCCIAVSSFC